MPTLMNMEAGDAIRLTVLGEKPLPKGKSLKLFDIFVPKEVQKKLPRALGVERKAEALPAAASAPSPSNLG